MRRKSKRELKARLNLRRKNAATEDRRLRVLDGKRHKIMRTAVKRNVWECRGTSDDETAEKIQSVILHLYSVHHNQDSESIDSKKILYFSYSSASEAFHRMFLQVCSYTSYQCSVGKLSASPTNKSQREREREREA